MEEQPLQEPYEGEPYASVHDSSAGNGVAGALRWVLFTFVLDESYPLTSVVMLVACATMARMFLEAWRNMTRAFFISAELKANFTELKAFVDELGPSLPGVESAYVQLAEEEVKREEEAAKAPAYFEGVAEAEGEAFRKKRRPSLLQRLIQRTPGDQGKKRSGTRVVTDSPDTPSTPTSGVSTSFTRGIGQKGRLGYMMQMGMLSEEEREQLKEMINSLKQRVPDLPTNMIIGGDPDATYQRFLLARGDVQMAEDMLADTVAWRKKFGIESILSNVLDLGKLKAYYKFLPHTYFGFDMDTRPIYWARVGHASWKLLMQRCTNDDLAHFHIVAMEYVNKVLMQEASRMKGTTQDQAVYILDMAGFSIFDVFSTPVMDFLKGLVSIFQNHYPEQLAEAVVINAPASFAAAWALAGLLGIDPVTKAKFRVVSVGATHVALREMVEEKYIPEYLAGKGKLAGDFFNFAGEEQLMEAMEKDTALTAFQRNLINHTLQISD